jgi:hypothetical protein
MARELGCDAEALATELDAARRETAVRPEPKDYGYGLPLTEHAAHSEPATVPTPLARERAAELTRAIGPTADAWIVVKGNTVTAFRAIQHASSAELMRRLDRALASERSADAAMTEAEATGMEATISAAKARMTRAVSAVVAASDRLEAARIARFGHAEWDAFTEHVAIAQAEAEALNVSKMAAHVVKDAGTRRDVMPAAYVERHGGKTREDGTVTSGVNKLDPDYQPSDPVGERVVRNIVDREAMGAIVNGVLDALVIVQAMRDAARAEAKAESKRNARAVERAERAAQLDPAMARLANSTSRRRR